MAASSRLCRHWGEWRRTWVIARWRQAVVTAKGWCRLDWSGPTWAQTRRVQIFKPSFSTVPPMSSNPLGFPQRKGPGVLVRWWWQPTPWPAFHGKIARSCDPSFSPRWRGVVAGESRARVRSWWTMVAHVHRYLVEGIVTAAFTLPALLRGKP
jgi:hypothetical protein